jgi:hypothetical protein
MLVASFYEFSEQTATLYNINSLVFIIEVESVYNAVRTDSLYKTYVSSLRVINVTDSIPLCWLDNYAL